MADSITIARPYAKAVFEHALAVGKLKEWSELLHGLVSAVLDSRGLSFITNPATSSEQHCELLLTAVQASPSEQEAIKSLITTLADNKRLVILPETLALYEAMRAEQEKTLEVAVVSFSALSHEQSEHLAGSLGNRLQRKITLKVTIDKSLLGGAVINAGNLVIDGSVRGKLNKLKRVLAA